MRLHMTWCGHGETGDRRQADHEEAQQVHIRIAGACASQELVLLQGLSEWLQLLPERLDIGLSLAELQRVLTLCQSCCTVSEEASEAHQLGLCSRWSVHMPTYVDSTSCRHHRRFDTMAIVSTWSRGPNLASRVSLNQSLSSGRCALCRSSMMHSISPMTGTLCTT